MNILSSKYINVRLRLRYGPHKDGRFDGHFLLQHVNVLGVASATKDHYFHIFLHPPDVLQPPLVTMGTTLSQFPEGTVNEVAIATANKLTGIPAAKLGPRLIEQVR